MMRLFTWAALLLVSAIQPAWAEGNAVRGEKLFSRCSSCHAVSGTRKVGPSLLGVIGRTSGTAPDTRYSAALKGAAINWDVQTLDAFLSNPKQLVPGTTMSVRVTKPEDRADIIEYLRTLQTQ